MRHKEAGLIIIISCFPMSRGVNVGCILRALTAERVGLVIAKKEISKENENSVCLNEKNVI